MMKFVTPSQAAKNRSAGQAQNASICMTKVIFQFSHEDIARRAYEIYVRKGCLEGQSEQNWLEAEEQLQTQEANRRASSCCAPSGFKIPKLR